MFFFSNLLILATLTIAGTWNLQPLSDIERIERIYLEYNIEGGSVWRGPWSNFDLDSVDDEEENGGVPSQFSVENIKKMGFILGHCW